jgi:hypothetical protein
MQYPCAVALRTIVLSGLVAAGVAAGAGAVEAHTQAAPKYICDGPEGTLFNNTNGGLVGGGGASPTFSTNGKTFCVTYIEHYHWNDGKGARGGAVGLKRAGGGAAQLPAQIVSKAKTSSGTNNAPNVNWYAYVPRSPQRLINGTYSCTDSDTASWSQDGDSGGDGFCIVRGALAVKTCVCAQIKIAIDPLLIKNTKLRSDQQDFGISFTETMTCTGGSGKTCNGTVKFLAPKILADTTPPPPTNLHLDIHSFKFKCSSPCGGTQAGTFNVPMTSTGQLNELFGRTLAFQIVAICNGVQTTQTTDVFIDGKGQAHPG